MSDSQQVASKELDYEALSGMPGGVPNFAEPAEGIDQPDGLGARFMNGLINSANYVSDHARVIAAATGGTALVLSGGLAFANGKRIIPQPLKSLAERCAKDTANLHPVRANLREGSRRQVDVSSGMLAMGTCVEAFNEGAPGANIGDLKIKMWLLQTGKDGSLSRASDIKTLSQAELRDIRASGGQIDEMLSLWRDRALRSGDGETRTSANISLVYSSNGTFEDGSTIRATDKRRSPQVSSTMMIAKSEIGTPVYAGSNSKTKTSSDN